MRSSRPTDIAISHDFTMDKMSLFLLKKINFKTSLLDFHKKNGTYFFTITRVEHNPSIFLLSIGKAGHYAISGGARYVVIAGEVEFKDKKVVSLNDQSGTYHLDLTKITSKKKNSVYQEQKVALAKVGFAANIIEKIRRPFDDDYTCEQCVCSRIQSVIRFFCSRKTVSTTHASNTTSTRLDL